MAAYGLAAALPGAPGRLAAFAAGVAARRRAECLQSSMAGRRVRRPRIFRRCHAAVARRSTAQRVGNDDIAFWMISQRILPPVAVVIPIYILFQQVELLDTRAA